MPPQARLGDKALIPADAHGCVACPHAASGPAVAGSPNVNVNGRPAIRVDDPGIHTACCGGNTWNAQTGSKSVFINGKPAHRLGDIVRHCGGVGKCIEGSGNVIVGDHGGRLQQRKENKTFDEQLQFINENGTPASHVRYQILLEDSTISDGTTDEQGRTHRIETDEPIKIVQAKLFPGISPSCCERHYHELSREHTIIVAELDSTETNNINIGSSVKKIKIPKKARTLTHGEIMMSQKIFGNSIEYGKVLIYDKEYGLLLGFQPDNVAVTPNGNMYFPKPLYATDFSVQDDQMKHLFIHEMTHVWQYQLKYPVKRRRIFLSNRSYEYIIEPGRRLDSYNMEAQGEILADYFALKFLKNTSIMRYQGNGSLSLQDYEKEVLVDFLSDPSNRANLPTKGSK